MNETLNMSLADGTHLYETEYRAYHLVREGFRVADPESAPISVCI